LGQTRTLCGLGLWHSALPRWSLFFALAAVLTFAVRPLSAAEPTARLGAVSGTVAVSFADGTAVQPAASGADLGPGDRISTVGKGTATIDLPGIGQIELGADTTVILQALRTDAGTTIVTIQMVQGMIVNRLAPAGDARLVYQVVDPTGAATALASGSTTFGVGRDENGNVTVACARCGSGTLSFPASQGDLGSGDARTLTARGDILDFGLHGSVYDALAEGAGADEDGGGKTANGNRLPAGQRTGSRDDRRTSPEDDDPGQNSAGPQPTATPSPTAVVSATATAPIVPSATATASPTATSSPTPTPTSGPVIAQEATISNFVYLPDPIQIRVGQSVRWTNLDNVESGHTVTADDHSFTSPVLGQGDTYVHTFTQVGTFEYFCEPHPFMTAFIDVQP
jgi:plastocyanin